ncbi:hypothetical protein AB0D59_33445 [Streptomyces sp. NPDC048417]|uniref:hypothetical protein n=1 Tax=Streptomyces sp. NPDC048417 TaxID=3155387 RepID=UPI00344252E3
MGALITGTAPDLLREHTTGKIDAKALKGPRDQLAQIRAFYLPLRSPELNDIERIRRSVQVRGLSPTRPHHHRSRRGAVDKALTRQQTRIRRSTENFTKAA